MNLGPSIAMNGGWICGSDGLAKAKSMIEEGSINAAIIGVTNINVRPELQLQYLDKLNKTVNTKSFNSDGKFSLILI